MEIVFGQRLADERRRLGLKQDEMAEAIGITRSIYAAMEGGRSPLYVDRLVRFEETVKVDIQYILTGKKTKEAAFHMLDWALIDQIQAHIHKNEAEHWDSLSPEKKALTLKLSYQECARDGKLNEEKVDLILQLSK